MMFLTCWRCLHSSFAISCSCFQIIIIIKNYFIPKYFKIGSPLISPMPQHIPQRPSNDAKAPANTPATPSAERSHTSPSASSKLRPHQQRSRKRAPNPDIAPLSPPPTISGQNLFNVNSIEVTIIWWALSYHWFCSMYGLDCKSIKPIYCTFFI